MNRSLPLGMMVAAWLFITPARAQTAPGDLDPAFGGFGTGGKIQDLGFAVNAMAIDAQGRLVLVGSDHAGHFHVQRRTGPGFETAEDVSFSIDGEEVASSGHAVAFTTDGKIVVAGNLLLKDRPKDFAVARLNPDLTLDKTFAGDGTTSSDFNGGVDTAFGVVVQSDNKIVVGGTAAESSDTFARTNLAIERFNADGNLDRSFGDGNGKRFIDIEACDSAQALALQADGKILVAGSAETGDDPNFFDGAILRLNANGSDDGSFGDSGQVITRFSGHDTVLTSMALTTDGKILVAGHDFAQDLSIEVARYLSNGTLDTSFNRSGKLLVSPFANATAVVAQPDHKIVVAGQNFPAGAPTQFIVLRYNEDGSPDTTFAGTGTTFTAFETNTGVNALALQSDGMLIAAGGAQAARYRSDGSLDAGGTMDLIFDPAHRSSEVTALAVAPDGKLVAAGKVFHPDYDMALARFAADYHDCLDLSFGNGLLFVPKTGRTLSGLAGENEEIRALALQSDGGIVVGGQLLAKNGQNEDLMMGRFTAEGMPVEMGFFPPRALCNGVGFNSVDFGFGDDAASAVVVTADGKTYTAGTVRGPTGNDFGLVRFASDCSVDSTGAIAGNEYKVRLDLGGEDAVGGMVLQNGLPVVAGTSNGAITLIRVRTDNLGRPQLDGSFGTAGRSTLPTGTLPPGTTAVITGLATQSDGKLIVSGWATFANGQTHFVVARFSAAGQLDTSFGGGGVISPGFNMLDTANALALRSDDTIAVAGSTQTSEGTLFALVQFTADGRIDTGFNGTGQVTLRLGPDGEDVAQAVTFVGANHLVLGGYSTVFGIRQFALAAFETTPATTNLSCAGDCNDDGSVAVDELLTLVNIALGTADVSTCAAGDLNHNGQITVDEILAGVSAALNGCSGT